MGKRAQGRQSVHAITEIALWEPLLWSFWRFSRESARLSHWESDYGGDVRRAWKQSLQWSGPSSYLQCPSRMPTQQYCSSAEPTQGTIWKGNSVRYTSAWFRSSNNELCWFCRRGLPTPRQGLDFCLTYGRVFWHHLTRRTSNNC